MNYKDVLKEKLKKYNKDMIVITDHAWEQAVFREISLDEVKENIINPERLLYAIRQKAIKAGEEKYDCYFGYSERLCHRYVLVVNRKCIVCTMIRINRRWQHTAEKNAKIQV